MCQFILMPLISFGIALGLGVTKEQGISMLVVGCSPGGSTSNLVVKLKNQYVGFRWVLFELYIIYCIYIVFIYIYIYLLRHDEAYFGLCGFQISCKLFSRLWCQPLGNLFAYYSRADLPLSILATSLSTLLSVGMMPLCMFIYSGPFTDESVAIPLTSLITPLSLAGRLRDKRKEDLNVQTDMRTVDTPKQLQKKG